jgi:hypothetical protein
MFLVTKPRNFMPTKLTEFTDCTCYIFQIHKADEASILSGYLNVMDKDHKWTKKWITVHDDFALYFYKKHKVSNVCRR